MYRFYKRFPIHAALELSLENIKIGEINNITPFKLMSKYSIESKT